MRYKVVTVGGTFDYLHKGHRAILRRAFEISERVVVGVTSDAMVARLKGSPASLQKPARGSIFFQTQTRPSDVHRSRPPDEQIKDSGFDEDKPSKIKRSSSEAGWPQTSESSKKLSPSHVSVPGWLREREVGGFLRREGLADRAEVVEINDIFGPLKEVKGQFVNLSNCQIEAMVVTGETKENAKKINRWRKRNGLSGLDIVEVKMERAEDGGVISSGRIRAGEINREGVVYRRHRLWGRLPRLLRPELRQPLGRLCSPASLQKPARGSKKLSPSHVSVPGWLGKISTIFTTRVGKNVLCTGSYATGLLKDCLLIKHPRESAIIRGNPLLVTVGDISTKRLIEAGIKPDVAVFDLKVRRKRVFKEMGEIGVDKGEYKVKKVKNPAGGVSKEMWDFFSRGDRGRDRGRDKGKVAAWVEGEEDLAVLPAVLFAPLGTVVVYGQPPLRSLQASSAQKPARGSIFFQTQTRPSDVHRSRPPDEQIKDSGFDEDKPSKIKRSSSEAGWPQTSESSKKLSPSHVSGGAGSGLVVVRVGEEEKERVFGILRKFKRG